VAKFGTSRYDSGFKYGEVSTVNVYYNSGLVAWSYNYGTVQLTWNTITPNPNDPAPTYWALVKSYSGSLDNPLDAILIDGGPISAFSTSYTDVNNNLLDQEYSYSIWLFNGSSWINCGDSYAIVISDKDSLLQVSSWLPKAWINEVSGVGDGAGEVDTSNTLVNILDAFTFMYDKFRVEASLLMLQNYPQYTPSALLDFKGPSFGVTYEDALGDSYNRSLASAGFLINKYKGSPQGLSIYTNGLTHWQNSYVPGHNLLLDYNDSSFEESIGRWQVSSGTFVHALYSGSGLTPPPAFSDPTYTPRVLGFGELTTTATTAVTMSLPGTLSAATYGVPVVGNTRYVFSGWVQHLDHAATVTATISWYDMYQNLISTTSAGTTLTTTASWSEFTSKSDSGRNGQLAPLNAVYATVVITVTPSSSSSSRYAFDYFQFSEYSTSFEYEDARKTSLVVNGQKENYIINPDFELGAYSWSALNGTLLADSSNLTSIVHGSRSLKLTSTASGTAAYISDWIPVDSGQTMTFSAYVSGSAARTAILRVEFTNQSSPELQTDVLSDSNGFYYPTTSYYAESTPYTLTGSANQIQVTAITSPYGSDVGNPVAKVSIYFSDNQAGDQYWIDGVMAEEAYTASDYFGGSGGITPTNPLTQYYYAPADCYWETRSTYNYLHNPSFELSTTDWTATSGTLTVVTIDGSTTPAYGTHFAKVTYTTTGTITSTAYLPYAAVGGEDFYVSALVQGAVGTYTINGTSYTIPSTEAANWTRMTSVTTLTPGQTTVPVSISVTNTSGSTSTVFHVDAVQAGYGRNTNGFIDTTAATTAVLINPLNTAKNIYATKVQNPFAGKSSYFNNSVVKLSRLNNTLANFLPVGTSYRINMGDPTDPFSDIPNSLFPASSFEQNLGTWAAVNSTITRQVAGGTLLNDPVTHGQAYGVVTTAGSSGSKSFGIKTGKIYLQPTSGFYCSAAIRPQNTDSLGSYTLEVDWYDANNNPIVIYTDAQSGLLTTNAISSNGASNTVSTTGRQYTTNISVLNRWAYLANTFPVSTITGAAYAIISVTFNPTSYAADQAFDIDRVVFRQ
jgi:hypothetical protein